MSVTMRSFYHWKPPPGSVPDMGHPWFRNLRYWALLNEGSGTVIRDYSGNGNTGTMASMTWTQRMPGFGTAVNNSGTQDGIIVPTSPSLNISGNQVTMLAWVTPRNSSVRVVGGSPYTTTHTNPFFDWALFYSGIGADDQWNWRVDSTNFNSGTSYQTPSDELTQVVGTYDGANMHLYVNGILANSSAKTGNLHQGAQGLYIGINRASGEDWHGDIGTVMVWGRALSQKEVWETYIDPFQPFKPGKQKSSYQSESALLLEYFLNPGLSDQDELLDYHPFWCPGSR